jgi:tetratricopeptide (TPR) repeat protein
MSLFERIAKVNHPLAALAAVLGAAAWFHPAVAGSDLWWHLASGRRIWETASVPTTDPFSFTFGGQPWMNHEWLWDVIYWGAYRIDPQTVAWLNLAVLVVVFSGVFALARRESGSLLAAGAVTWMAAASAHWFLDIRPHLFTLLLVGILLLTREWKHAPWLWAPLMVIWANLHAGFAFGFGTMGLLVLTRTLQPSLSARRLVVPLRDWICLGLAFLALLVTPWGYHVWEYPAAYLDSGSPFRQIIEWQPPRLDLNPRNFQGRFWIYACVAALGLPMALRRSPFLAALALVTFAMAATSRRFIPLFAVTAAPTAARALAWGLQALRTRMPLLRHPMLELGCGALALALASLLWLDVRVSPRLLERWTQSDLYPRAAVRYLNALGPPRRLLNYYNWGGYLMLHAPEVRLYIDGRANTLYDDRIYLEYLSLLRGGPGIASQVAPYHFDAALLPAGALTRALQKLPDPWRVLFAGPSGVILAPPTSPLLHQQLPDVQAVLGDEPALEMLRAQSALLRRDLPRATEHLEASLAAEPLNLHAYGTLAQIRAMDGDVEGISQSIERGIRTMPRRREELRRLEARAYLQAGRPDLALGSLERAMPSGPFRLRKGTRVQIEQLREQVEAARQ